MLTIYLDLMLIAAVSASEINDFCWSSNLISTALVLDVCCDHNYRYVPEWPTSNCMLTISVAVNHGLGSHMQVVMQRGEQNLIEYAQVQEIANVTMSSINKLTLCR